MRADEYNNIVDLYADNVYRFILKNVKNEMIAEDIVQDAFEKMWIKHEDINVDKARSYLFSTAYHTMIDMIRREKKQDNWENVHELEHSQETEYDNLNEVLHQAIDKLPEKQKSVVMLRDYEGYAYNEIEEITGLNESQVKVYIYRARLFLRNYLEKMKVEVQWTE